jgi:predicted anti-sigma-YlaC factor YlaD
VKSHSRIRTLLATYRDLDAIDRADVDGHIRECASCAARLGAYQRMDHDLAGLEDPRPRRMARQVRADVLNGAARQVGVGPVRPALSALLPVGLLLLLIIGMLLVMQMSRTPGGQVAETPSTTPTPTTLVMLSTPANVAVHATAALTARAPHPWEQRAPAPSLTVSAYITPVAARLAE